MPRITVAPDDPASADSRRLIGELDSYLNSMYPPDRNYLLSVEALKQTDVTFVTARYDDRVVGCGAFVNRQNEYAEIKRMFVLPDYRRRKIGRKILEELERRIVVSGLRVVRLETGVSQPEALRLYARAGYRRRGVFGEYADDPISVFMEKNLT